MSTQKHVPSEGQGEGTQHKSAPTGPYSWSAGLQKGKSMPAFKCFLVCKILL